MYNKRNKLVLYVFYLRSILYRRRKDNGCISCLKIMSEEGEMEKCLIIKLPDKC